MFLTDYQSIHNDKLNSVVSCLGCINAESNQFLLQWYHSFVHSNFSFFHILGNAILPLGSRWSNAAISWKGTVY